MVATEEETANVPIVTSGFVERLGAAPLPISLFTAGAEGAPVGTSFVTPPSSFFIALILLLLFQWNYHSYFFTVT